MIVGSAIRGKAGIGCVLDRGFDLPPLMLTSDEAEAVVFGAQLVVVNGDDGLARAAGGVLTTIAAIVPEHLSEAICFAPTDCRTWITSPNATRNVARRFAAAGRR